MFGLGTQEIIVVLVVALLLFGPQQLPEIGKQVGKAMREFQNMSSDVQQALMDDNTGYNRSYTSQPYRSVPAPKYDENNTSEHEADEATTAVPQAAAKIAEHETSSDSAVAVAPTHTEDKEVKAG